MKRSEMINIIKQELSCYFGGTDRVTWDQVSDSAEEILKAIEEAGMYPPDCSQIKCSDPVFSVYVDNIDIPHRFQLGWEDE